MLRLICLATLAALVCGAPQRIGRPLIDGRIVGGEETTIEEYPYQLSLLSFGSHICGASIISENFAVTAAHCTDGSTARTMSVRAGSSTRNSGGVVVGIKAIHQNPAYDRANIDYDISVLELEESLTLGAGIQPIDLPALNELPLIGSDAICTGWGALREGAILLPSQLQTVTVQIVSNDECNVAYGSITDRMICAGVPEGGKDACQGDSGGPLVVAGKLAGIVSWGYGCARQHFPGVYSNVATLRDYITENAGI